MSNDLQSNLIQILKKFALFLYQPDFETFIVDYHSLWKVALMIITSLFNRRYHFLLLYLGRLQILLVFIFSKLSINLDRFSFMFLQGFSIVEVVHDNGRIYFLHYVPIGQYSLMLMCLYVLLLFLFLSHEENWLDIFKAIK